MSNNVNQIIYGTDLAKAESLPCGLKALKEDTPTGKFYLKMWRPKAIKYYCYYSFKTPEARQEYINKQVASFLARKERIEQDKQARQIHSRQEVDLKRGDLFYTSWGYDQTNYDYIVVLEVSASGKSALCQRTSSLHTGECGQSNVQEPIFCPFGDQFTMKIVKGYKSEICLRGSYPFLCDGKIGEGKQGLRLDTFWKAKEGDEFHETMIEFGH